MGKVRRRIAAVTTVVVVAACSPIAAGPELPRPPTVAMSAPSTFVTTTLPPQTTTTTIDPADAMAAECPEEFCLVYEIEAGATWSDGTPISPDDFARTHQAAIDPTSSADPGYRLISSVDVIDSSRVRVVFAEPYGPWQALFNRLIGPDGATSGPFQIVDRVPGDRIVVERVDGWWPQEDPVSGASLGDVTEITFVFIDDPAEMVDALAEGEIDVMVARPDADNLADLASMPDVEYAVTPGRYWEHIDFNHDDPALRQPWLREAMALAIDREEILDRTARLIQPDALALDNTLYMTGTRHYQSHYDFDFDPVAAERILISNGCERPDEIYVCGGTPLRFVWASTSDDAARRVAYDLVSESLAAVGIELIADFRTPSAFVSTDFLLGGPDRWQLANFAWRASDEPSHTGARYECGGSLFNVNRYCSTAIEDMIDQAAGTIDTEQRADLYNEADRLYLEALATIPLYQKPELMAWTSDVNGPIPNHSVSSNLWNVAAWTGQTSIVVALPAEPGQLDPFVTTDDSANMVLAGVMYGALGMDPSLAPRNVLVGSVSVVKG